VAVPDTRPYFQRPLIILLVLGSFWAITLPLAGLLASGLWPETVGAIVFAYGIILGRTHFFVTLSIYLRRENLEYFRSTRWTRLVYFGVPSLLLLGIFAIDGLRLSTRFTAFFFVFNILVRWADFTHVCRQHYGVFQIFRGQSGGTFPKWTAPAVNAFFMCMALMQTQTFLRDAHGVDWALPRAIGLAVAGGLGVAVTVAMVLAWLRTANRAALVVPTVYLLSQAAGAALVLYRVEFYTVTLAMHYVEYHLIMVPRCFAAPLDETSRVDRVMAWLRRHKPIFYAGLLGLALWVTVWGLVWARQPDTSRIHAFGALFNGIFLVHFFIEAFIWKFSNPYFRRTLSPLYFPSRPKAGEAA
jgi:hypothetical protein